MNENMNELVEVFPNPLVISRTGNEEYFTTQLNLTNKTDSFIVFKIYNNQKALYSAKPSTSFIPPKQNVSIAIKRYNKNFNEFIPGKDKFLLIFYSIQKVINNNDEAKAALKAKDYIESSKQETLIDIIIRDENYEESVFTYNESELLEIGDDFNRGIKIYEQINEKLKKQSNVINKEIEKMEKQLETIKLNKNLKTSKDKAIDNSYQNKKPNTFFLGNIILIASILFGLIFGANLSKFINYLSGNHIKNLDTIIYTNKKIDNNTNANSNGTMK